MEEVVMSVEALDKLTAITQWYDAMPDAAIQHAGDRFHENIRELQVSLLPEFYNSADFYLSHFEFDDDGALVVALGSEAPQEDGQVAYKYYKPVAG